MTIGPTHIYYNSVAASILKFTEETRVIYHVDEDERKLGFEFTDNAASGRSVFKKQSGSGWRSSSCELVTSLPWVRSVACLNNTDDRRFQLFSGGKLWFVRLCPAFEFTVSRAQASQISDSARGIYRYRNAVGDVVYIGKGHVRSRLAEAQRKNWLFETIEYSLIGDDKKQFQWEAYWIDKHKSQSNQQLPVYNAVSGHSIEEAKETY